MFNKVPVEIFSLLAGGGKCILIKPTDEKQNKKPRGNYQRTEQKVKLIQIKIRKIDLVKLEITVRTCKK